MNEITLQIKNLFAESMSVKNAVLPTLIAPIERAILMCKECFELGGKIMVCGNGGSAADSQHFSAELLNRFEKERKPIPAIALSTDTSTITAIGNDYDYKLIFAKQVYALAKAEDILLAISTSGGSKNVIEAVKVQQQKGGMVIALTGNEGGEIAKILNNQDVLINVACANTARVQEVHIMVLHALCAGIDKVYSPN